ncbi:MAG: 2,3-bisphosphoglycerate-independent phosphoglycerate mutase [Trueperaceae bacterium]|nr:MAG: 2,3-bisphosphoglycerate-independent phosphoglycerate mutase [Trueperaceae bacterium]
MTRPVALIVLDGFGCAPEGPGNAVRLAQTPHFNYYWQHYPHTTLKASGRAVGLPEGQIGNSEVGHLNIGSGRVVLQSLTYLQDQIDSGAFYDNPALNTTIDAAQNRAIHLLGLVSQGGVHSSLNHLYALLKLCVEKGAKAVYIHAFTDGRDTAPDSGLGILHDLQEKIDDLNHNIHIASVCGRYFAMDRDKRWERTQRAYDAIVCGKSQIKATSGLEAVHLAYERGESDEFIQPTVVQMNGNAVGTVEDGDAVIFFNFRADRARQLTYAFFGDRSWTEFTRCSIPQVEICSLMQYDQALDARFAFELPAIDKSLAEVLSNESLKQYHTAETEKYAHVTYFFNAKREQAFPGETRRLIPSPKVATYDLQPAMSAPELTSETLKRISEEDDDFILVNFANPDMVGHTGKLEAAIEACEATDRGMGLITEAILKKGGAVLVIADHGNAEVMIAPDGGPHTAHTTNPVPCIVVGAPKPVSLRPGGILGDVAPTVLELLDLRQPTEMTGQSLLVET